MDNLLDECEQVDYAVLRNILILHLIKDLFIHHSKHGALAIRQGEPHLDLLFLVLALLLLLVSVKDFDVDDLKIEALCL